MKKVLALLLAAVMIFGSISFVFAADDTPKIVYIPWKLEPGTIGAVYGGGFGTDTSSTTVYIEPLAQNSGMADIQRATTVKPISVSDTVVQFVVPENLAYDVYAVWVKTKDGITEAVYTNKAQIFWVNEHEIYEGQTLTVAGRNMVNPLNRSADGVEVLLKEAGTDNKLKAHITDITDYTVTFIVPSGIVSGKQYDIVYTNGAGGNAGYAEMLNVERERMTAYDKNAAAVYLDDKYNLNINWFGDIDTSRVINVKEYGAIGDGVTDDTEAVQSALDAVGDSGAIVYFPNGTYLMHQIYVWKNTLLTGESTEGTILLWNGELVPETPRTTLRRSAMPQYSGGTMDFGEANIFIYSDRSNVGVFDLTISSGDTIRPTSDIHYNMYGHFAPLCLFGMFDCWGDEKQPESVTESPRGGNYVLKNVNIKTKDGSGPLIWTEEHLVVEDCNFDVTHYGIEMRGTNHTRFLRNTIKNTKGVSVLTIGQKDTKTKTLYDVGQAWIQDNTMIGDCLLRRIQEGKTPDPGWGELVGALEHRVTDFGGDENLIFRNDVSGTYGDNTDNNGEGIQTQGADRKIVDKAVGGSSDTIVSSRNLESLNNPIYPGFDYITIIGGTGMGQIRNVKSISGNTLTVDKTWTIEPDSTSVYFVNGCAQARTIIAENNFAASNNKGSIHFYGSDYDSVIANNNVTNGGGIWYRAVIQQNDYCEYQHFLTIENNYVSGSSNPGFSMGNATAIGPGGDGGIVTYYGGDINATTLYGIRIINNEVKGIGKDIAPKTEFNSLFTDRTGIYVSSTQDSPYPAAMSTIVDGNIVSDCKAGIHLNNTSYYTVIRNNTLTGNLKEIREDTKSTGTIYLDAISGEKSGVQEVKPIDKSSIKQIDMSLVIDSNRAVVNGVEKYLDVPAMVINDRTLTPARFVAENMGATVDWDGDTQTVTITLGDNYIKLVIDSNVAIVNGQEKYLDVPAMVINDRTLTPARFVAENLGATVDWYGDTQTVVITK